MTAGATAAEDRLHVPCAHCHAVVRVPRERLGERPHCPKCKSELLEGRPIVLDADGFAQHIGRGDLPVLVDFWAPWCGPCHAMAPVLDRAAAQWSTSLRIGKVDTDRQPELAGRFGIRSIPTLILFRDGREIARHSGAVDLGSLARWLEPRLRG